MAFAGCKLQHLELMGACIMGAQHQERSEANLGLCQSHHLHSLEALHVEYMAHIQSNCLLPYCQSIALLTTSIIRGFHHPSRAVRADIVFYLLVALCMSDVYPVVYGCVGQHVLSCTLVPCRNAVPSSGFRCQQTAITSDTMARKNTRACVLPW